ncbi:phage integrase N-terminal SAM-like domain-containing protein [Companilactobacillus allii]|uniref:Recombinase XerD n=1 Tax=Companilactobacillus allii TaxID=1847728 RepID=A0A1P8Q4Q7_9LACO|nr:phage integrase N-terminal SAM-like domain-containing protein [Companilactobacillus allii]APX72838.1 recombinase XerD [Companilactobacillus allii]USQ67625.1 phage integrase N-terminal SAM-like domain-containing protein [Companilactobacillus allii]
MSKIPYLTGFNAYLKTRHISKRAHVEYMNSLNDFFSYTIQHNDDYKISEDIKDVHEMDVRLFKTFMLENLKLSPSTVNKVISNLNVYFKYLFGIKKTPEIPTLYVNSVVVPKQSDFPVDVFQNLPKYLNSDLSIYTRLMILIISKGFNYKEALEPDFYKEFEELKFTTIEKKFLEIYQAFITPLRSYWGNQNLFLSRNKGANSPLLSVSALHRDLKRDSEATNLDLSPKKLYTTFILLALSTNDLSDNQDRALEALETASLLYYRRLKREVNFMNDGRE